MFTNILPFALSILVSLCQPILDLPWKKHFEELYSAREANLEGAAAWISTIAAFVPSFFLTLYGVALIAAASEKGFDKAVLLTIFGVSLFTSLLLYLWESLEGVPERRPVLKHYNYLQAWLFFWNVVGIGAAIWFH